MTKAERGWKTIGSLLIIIGWFISSWIMKNIITDNTVFGIVSLIIVIACSIIIYILWKWQWHEFSDREKILIRKLVNNYESNKSEKQIGYDSKSNRTFVVYYIYKNAEHIETIVNYFDYSMNKWMGPVAPEAYQT